MAGVGGSSRTLTDDLDYEWGNLGHSELEKCGCADVTREFRVTLEDVTIFAALC